MLKKSLQMEQATRKRIEQSAKKRIDSFFIHQCVIRRFKHNHNDDYVVLLSIRNDIESVLCNSGLRPTPRHQFEISITEVTLASMRFFENKINRSLLKCETLKNIRDKFFKHLSLSIVSNMDIEEYLSDQIIDDIINILKKNIVFMRS